MGFSTNVLKNYRENVLRNKVSKVGYLLALKGKFVLDVSPD
jgi:hypothetical protein